MPDWRQVAETIAKGEGIDPALFAAQIGQESGFDPGARSPAGAVGIAQIVPQYHPGVDPTDPIASLRYAAKWMRQLIDQYDGDVRKALAHYNGGGGAVQALMSGKPYGETVQYLSSILGPRTAEAAELNQQGGATVAGGYGNPEIDRIIAAKGDPTSITPIDPEIDKEIAGVKTGQKVPNPTPKYRFFWAKDGSSLDVQTSADGVRAIIAGNAGAKTDPPGAGGPHPNIERDGVTYIWDAKHDTYRPAPGVPIKKTPAATKVPGTVLGGQSPNEKYIVVLNPDGTRTQEPNPNYVPPKAQTSTHVIGGRIYTTDAEGNVIKTTDARTPQDITKENQGITKGALDIAKAQEDLLPGQQVIIQKQLETIAYVRGLIAKGQLDPDQGDKYLNATRAAAESALRGTTPFAEQKQLEEVQRAAATDASGLLRERMQSMTSLGSSLASSALSGASHAMFRPGQTSFGYDPLAMAKQFSSDAGGDKLLEVANALLARAGLPAGNPASGAPGVPSAPTSQGLVAGALTPPVAPAPGLTGPGTLPAGLTARAA